MKLLTNSVAPREPGIADKADPTMLLIFNDIPELLSVFFGIFIVDELYEEWWLWCVVRELLEKDVLIKRNGIVEAEDSMSP